MTEEFRLTASIYTLPATIRAADAFKHLCRVRVLPANDETWVTLEVGEHQANVIDEFLNYALALSAQELLS